MGKRIVINKTYEESFVVGFVGITILVILIFALRLFLHTTYVGTLPCADCSGITTTLTLTQGNLLGNEGTYQLSMTYEGKNAQPFVTKGIWTLQNDMIYTLWPGNKADQPMYWLKTNTQTLQMLDTNKQKINSPFNETLTKTL